VEHFLIPMSLMPFSLTACNYFFNACHAIYVFSIDVRTVAGMMSMLRLITPLQCRKGFVDVWNRREEVCFRVINPLDTY
jgi:hypothetical protein